MTLFSVVVATYGRGAAIAPTLQAIADQTVADLEVLVVSDGPAAAGLAETVAGFGPRFALHEIPVRLGSQSGPNNRGIELARGRYVAYLGHDDLWLPDHLARLAAVFEDHPEVDFAVAGCILVGPSGRVDELTWVSGIFEPDDATAPAEHFFPPSSFAHRRQLPHAVGPWPEDPTVLRLPVDSALLLAAVEAGCRFRSTGEVSVLKFASALRYLSYLAPDDVEQRRAAEALATREAREAFVADRIRVARDHGNFMNLRHPDPATLAHGEAAAHNESVRGNSLPAPSRLTDSAWLEPGEEFRGSDWHGPEADGGRVWRWSGPSTTPRLAIPYTHPDPVRVRIHLRTDQGPLAAVAGIEVNGEETPYRLTEGPDGAAIELRATLRERLATVVELTLRDPHLITRPGLPDPLLVGVPLSGIELESTPAASVRGDAGDGTRAAAEARLARVTRDLARLQHEHDEQADVLADTRQHALNLEEVRRHLERALESQHGEHEAARVRLEQELATQRAELERVRRARRRAVRRLRELDPEAAPSPD